MVEVLDGVGENGGVDVGIEVNMEPGVLVGLGAVVEGGVGLGVDVG